MTFLKLAACALLLLPVAAHADIASPQPQITYPPPRKTNPVRPLPQNQPAPANNDSPRDPVNVARKTPAIAARIAKVRGGQFGAANDQSQSQMDERITQIQLDGQCGFAGCSSTTLVVFTYQTRGANTATSSVMALVACPPIMRQGCSAVPAEVKPQGSLEQTR